MKKKFGIISSFNVLCGNATYSDAIATGMKEDFEVIKIDVPIFLQKRYDPQLVKELLKSINECDYINIQMEFGLYGPTPAAALRVLRALVKKCKKFSVTMHRVDEPPKIFLRQIYDSLKSRKFMFIHLILIAWLKDRILSDGYTLLVDEVVSKGGEFIVHTERERVRIIRLNKKAKTRVYPIIWPIESHAELDLKQKFTNKYPVVGLFGFVTQYKNYEVVAEGLVRESFNILIAGGVHPQSPSYGQSSTNEQPSYFRKISSLFSLKYYKNRVFVFTSPSDAQLIQLIKSVDVVCIPYLETGQSGSGIASLAVQYGRSVVFSDTSCTRELVRFLNSSPIMFDTDSPLGLACAVKSAVNSTQKIEFQDFDFSGLLRVYKNASGFPENS